MYKHLYDIFKHWYCTDGKHQNSIWLFSDPHFNDGGMQYLRKNYIGDEEQVKRLNSKIGKNDTLICLGDVGDISFIKKLRGYKVLIMGNHDKGASYYQRKEDFETISLEEADHRLTKEQVIREGWFLHDSNKLSKSLGDNRLFDEVYEGPLIIGPKLILSHEPVDWPFGVNIHGHDHSGHEIKDDLHVNLCVEHINYTPVCLKTIVESGRLGSVDDIHRVTINGAIERKARKNKRVLEK